MSQIHEKKKSEKKIECGINAQSKKIRKQSLNSSSDSESYFLNIKKDIKNLIENDDDLSFSSNSDQDLASKNEDIDYLLEARFWKPQKNIEITHEKKNMKNDKEKNGIREESNKQSTQENEDDEIRNDIIHSSSESNNNSPLNTYINNEINDNEKKFEKNLYENKEQKDKINTNIKNNNNDINNINVSNMLLNGSNYPNSINYKNINNYSKFVFPYEHINYMGNQNMPNFFSGTYLAKNYINYNPNYNISSQIDNNKNLIQINNNNNNNSNVSKLTKLLNEVSNSSKDNKPNNTTKETSTQSSQKLSSNYTSQKLNVNMTYNPHLQNSAISSINKQPKPQTSENTNNKPNNSNISSEIKNQNKSSTITQEKKSKNIESKNTSNNSNNKANNNNKKIIEQNFTKNDSANNNTNFATKKCEKLFLNLDDIASGKDLRTTIMIRNIPIKYTDNILNETFKEFHGKYDCLYMPYDHEKKGNKGYAFINFVNPLHILLFYEKFNGEKWVHFESSKICELNMAHFQGYNEIQKHAKNFKELKKSCFKFNEKVVIPSKYLNKIKKRFPKMKYSENSKKNEFEILSFN